MSQNRVRAFYDSNPTAEWQRLAKDAYHTIEFEITMRFIKKYLGGQSADIIDIGGGPGRYTLELLQAGHSVALVDLSPNLLSIAESQIEVYNLKKNLIGIFERDGTNLEKIEDNRFDLTLLFGPYYHLTSAEDRRKCLVEAQRVTKPGGLIFTSVINRLCPFRDMLTNPVIARERLRNDFETVKNLVRTGVCEDKTAKASWDAYFTPVTEIPMAYKDTGIQLLEAFSCEGIASFIDDDADEIAKDPLAWERLLDVIYETSTDPSLLGAGEHSVYVGRKQ